MCSLIKIHFFISLIFILINSISLTPIIENIKNDCCFTGRKYANLKQDFQHFIQLDKLNLDRKRRTNNIDQLVRQTDLSKLSNLFTKIHLNRHFYTNSSICEIKDKFIWNNLHLPINNEECQFEFINCCLDEQLQFAIGIDIALRSRFKQMTKDQIVNYNHHNHPHHHNDGEIEYYNISNANEIRLNCNLLIYNNNSNNNNNYSNNKTYPQVKSTDEQINSITMISIGQNIAFDVCESCSYGIQQFDQFENCNNLIADQKYLIDNKFFKQCCRIIYLSKLAENRGLIKINKSN